MIKTTLSFLTTLTLFDWLMIAGASWAFLAAVTAIPIGRAMSRADITRRATYPPPPPPPSPRPPTQADIDATWLDAWPAETPEFATAEEAEQAVYDRLFDRLITQEGWAA